MMCLVISLAFKGGYNYSHIKSNADICLKLLIRLMRGTSELVCMHANMESKDPHQHFSGHQFVWFPLVCLEAFQSSVVFQF